MTTISIIGSGGMAAAIGGRAARAGHIVEVISRDPARARTLADRLVGATTGTYGTAPEGDLVVLAVPYAAAAATIADHAGALAGKVIIDVSNPIAPDLTGVLTPEGSSGAEEIARLLPGGTPVVKAFNTLFGPVLEWEGKLDAYFAADDPKAKVQVSAFLESLGLRPLDAGELHMAHSLESLGLLLIGLARNGAGTFDIAMNLDRR